MIDPGWVDQALRIATFAISIGAMIVAWVRTQNRARDDMHAILIRLTQLTGEMGVMRESMNSQVEIMRRVEAVVGRHEEHLLSKGGP